MVLDPGAGDVISALRWLRQKYAEFQKSRLLKRYDRIESARLKDCLFDFLQEYYSVPLLSRAGITYPVFCTACTNRQGKDVDSILGDLSTDKFQQFIIDQQDYLKTLRHLGKALWNGRTYIMERATIAETITIDCNLGWYFDAMTSCDILEWELLEIMTKVNCNRYDFRSVKSELKLRNEYQAKVSDPIHQGLGRSAMISISTLIVYNDGETYRGLLLPRSGKTAAHANLYHVVPSAIFQPEFGYPEEEFSVSLGFFREYLEEVFGEKEMEASSGELAASTVYEHEKSKELLAAIEEGLAELLLTGFAMNLLNLRPEICTVLIVYDPTWWKQKISPNWEFLKPRELFKQKRDVIAPIDILREDQEIAVDLNRIRGTFVPPGSAAFWLGIDTIRRLIGPAN